MSTIVYNNMSTNNAVIKYVHEPDAHNLVSPSIIVPYLVEKFRPGSVVDVGCGIGTFLHVFKKSGVQEVLGIDGAWVNKAQLNIDTTEFLEADLEKPIRVEKTFDLVLCLEVAEHLAPAAADTFVESLTALGKKIVFSAATKKQGGQNHINEQLFQYWKEKFEARGYKVIDLFRPVFWNEEKVQWWYKQNMFFIVHESVDTSVLETIRTAFSDAQVMIHPDLYYERIQEYDKQFEGMQRLQRGEGGNFNFYLGLLYKSLMKKIGR